MRGGPHDSSSIQIMDSIMVIILYISVFTVEVSTGPGRSGPGRAGLKPTFFEPGRTILIPYQSGPDHQKYLRMRPDSIEG